MGPMQQSVLPKQLWQGLAKTGWGYGEFTPQVHCEKCNGLHAFNIQTITTLVTVTDIVLEQRKCRTEFFSMLSQHPICTNTECAKIYC